LIKASRRCTSFNAASLNVRELLGDIIEIFLKSLDSFRFLISSISESPVYACAYRLINEWSFGRIQYRFAILLVERGRSVNSKVGGCVIDKSQTGNLRDMRLYERQKKNYIRNLDYKKKERKRKRTRIKNELTSACESDNNVWITNSARRVWVASLACLHACGRNGVRACVQIVCESSG